MREIIKLMFPVHFRGNIYHKAAMFICLPFLIVCYCLSVWSNTHGIESVFASLPNYALNAASLAAYALDPINWMCFTLLIVSVQAFRIFEQLEKNDQLPEQLTKGIKPVLVFSCLLFAVLVLMLTYATYLLSQKGGYTGASEYIAAEYAPKQGLDSLISGNKQALAQEIGSLKAAYASQIGDLSSRIGKEAAKEAVNKDWHKNGKSNWAMYNAYNKAKAEQALLRQELKQLRQLVEGKEADIKAKNADLLEAQKADYETTKAKHDALQAETAAIMAYAVKSWTLLGLFIQLISFVLTSDLYKTAAYNFVRQALGNYNRQQDSISKELLAVSAMNRLPKQVIMQDEQPHKQPIMQPIEPPKLFDNPEQLPKQVIEPPVEQPKHEPKQPMQADRQPTQEQKKQERIRKAEQFLKIKPTPWLQKWRDALADPDLNNHEESGMSKRDIARKYSTSPGTVDNLRKAETDILAVLMCEVNRSDYETDEEFEDAKKAEKQAAKKELRRLLEKI